MYYLVQRSSENYLNNTIKNNDYQKNFSLEKNVEKRSTYIPERCPDQLQQTEANANENAELSSKYYINKYYIKKHYIKKQSTENNLQNKVLYCEF